MISGIVILGVKRDAVVGMRAVVLSLAVVSVLKVIAAVGAAVVMVLLGAKVDETGRLVGSVLDG